MSHVLKTFQMFEQEFASILRANTRNKGRSVGWFAARLHGEASEGAGRRMFRDEAPRWGCTRCGASDVRGDAARWSFTRGGESDGSNNHGVAQSVFASAVSS